MLKPGMFQRLSSTTSASKMIAVCGLTAMLLATAVGCGSDDKDESPPSTTAAAGDTPRTQGVSEAFETFFDGSTSADKKIELLENGPAFAETINAQAESPIAKATKASVTTVTITGADRADVTYTVLLNGSPALQDQPGAAIMADGHWKVAAATFCALLALQGNPPPVCSASATPTG